jgi:hypothetical protein
MGVPLPGWEFTEPVSAVDLSDHTSAARAAGHHGPSATIRASDTANGWIRRALLPTTASVTDIQFAPHYLGLRLAACTASGRVLVYEAQDIMELENWNTVYDFDVCAHRLGSLAWSCNRFNTPLLAVASDSSMAASNERVFFYRLNPNGTHHRWVGGSGWII